MVVDLPRVCGHYGSTVCMHLQAITMILVLTQTQHRTNDQHEELGHSRQPRDFNDLPKVITWFQYQSNDPFDPDHHQLGVNCR